MKVDSETLRDLEVIPTGDRAGNLLAHLDRTTTRGGRRAWRRRLDQPLETAEAIGDVQDALRFILSNPSALDSLPTDAELQALDAHLRSNVATAVARRWPTLLVESAWVRIRFPDQLRAILEGRSALSTVWRQMIRLARELSDGPTLLVEMADEIRAIGSPEVMGELLGDHGGRGWVSWGRALRADRLAREQRRASLLRLLDLAHELDALQSMAQATRDLNFCFPEMDGAGACLDASDVWHPFLAQPVSNDVRLGAGGEGHLVFLTGPNMAGKTTYLKAVGLLVLLAHTGMGVPARRCRLGLVQRLVCAFRTEDSLLDGVSYFQAEALRVRRIAEWVAQDPRCVVLVDELFRGTNVQDATDATETVIRGFARSNQGMFLISSHLIDVALELDGLPGLAFNQFEARVKDGGLEFSYRIRGGVSSQRLGMEVLRDQGVIAALDRIGTSVAGALPDHQGLEGEP